MGLGDYLPTRPLIVGGQQIATLRGLSLADAGVLMDGYAEPLALVWSKHFADPAADQVDRMAIAKTLLQVAPGAVAAMIALAADQPEDVEKAAKLPFPVQLQAMLDIGELTFGSEAEVKNFVATVIRAFQATTGALQGLTVELG